MNTHAETRIRSVTRGMICGTIETAPAVLSTPSRSLTPTSGTSRREALMSILLSGSKKNKQPRRNVRKADSR